MTPHRRLSMLLIVSVAVTLTAPLAAASDKLRVATFNLSLYGEKSDEVLIRLKTGDDSQAKHLAEIIQRVRPDVILLNEIDYEPQDAVLNSFCNHYLAVPQHASQSLAGQAEAIQYPYRYTAPVNTGRHSGFDLGRNGAVDATPGTHAYGGDAWGYGRYEGQYGMAILSRYPIDEAKIRTFQRFRWRDMPDAQLPDDAATPEPHDWYSAEALEQFPLSSKSHWDVPIVIDGRVIHLLASHPTPPTFDGPEDRNGRRNHDEIRFWVDYTGPAEQGAYIYDDNGGKGGLASPPSEPGRPAPGASFIILGDLNGDPLDGDGPAGISKLLAAPQILKYPPPASLGAAEQARLQGGANARHKGDPANDTCDPTDDPGPGNLHIDYVLPSADLRVVASGVFWPRMDDPLFKLAGLHPFPASDHRLVWVDLQTTTNGSAETKN